MHTNIHAYLNTHTIYTFVHVKIEKRKVKVFCLFLSFLSFFLMVITFALADKTFTRLAHQTVVVHTFNPALGRQRQDGLYEFEANLVHKVSSRTSQDYIEINKCNMVKIYYLFLFFFFVF